MSTAKKTIRKPRKKLNRYRVWFKDGSEAVMLAEYPNQVYDLLPVEIRMKVDRVVDEV